MNDRKNDRLEYDVQKRARAGTAATFRAVVAVYILYLGYKLITGAADGGSGVPAWAGWTFGVFFLLAGLGFGVYIWKRYRMDLEAARLPETEEDAGEETEEYEEDAPDAPGEEPEDAPDGESDEEIDQEDAPEE